jgi:hypothetical protein
MSEEHEEDGFWAGLVGVPLEVVRLIKDDKVLLSGMGAAVLVTLIAITAPEAGRFYALVVVGVIVLLVLIRAVSRWAGVEPDDPAPEMGPHAPADSARGNVAETSGRARAENVTMNARTGEFNRLTATGRSRVKGLRMNAGGDEALPPTGARKAPARRRRRPGR